MSEAKKKVSPKGGKKTKVRKPTARKRDPKKPLPKGNSINFYWIYGIVGISLLSMILLNSSGQGKEIQFSDFKKYAENEQIDKVTHDGQTYQVYLNEKGKQADAYDSRDGRSNDRVLDKVYSSDGPDKWFSMPPGDIYLEDFRELEKKYGFQSFRHDLLYGL